MLRQLVRMAMAPNMTPGITRILITMRYSFSANHACRKLPVAAHTDNGMSMTRHAMAMDVFKAMSICGGCFSVRIKA